jgi:PPE-repeat protein
VTAPVWMAAPPEVHSALLRAGPGPGPLLAAAAAWSSLSAEYDSAADELTGLLGAVEGGAWEGPTAAEYVAAHAPYLAWLTQASANSAQAAARHETVAAAYTAALAAMPTLPELAANHAVHGVLVATNFFGINTIPIALNEADYARMWVQAATTMATYETVAGTAVASTPPTAPAPQILKTDAQTQDSGDGHDHDHGFESELDTAIANLLRQITNGWINWDPAAGTLNGLPFDSYTSPLDPLWWVARALELLQQFEQFVKLLFENPILAIWYLIQLELFDWPTHILQLAPFIGPQLIGVMLGAGAAGVGAIVGLATLAGLPGVEPIAVPVAPPAPAPAPPPVVVPTSGSAAPVTAPATAPTSASAPASATAPASAPAPAPSAAAIGGFPPYLVGGGPGIGFGSGMSARAKTEEPASDSAAEAAAAAAQAAARKQARARRRRKMPVGERGHRDEYMDLDSDSGIPPTGPSASDQGAGPVGFAGTVRRDVAPRAAGLTALAGDEFGGGPREPMLPGTWDPDESDERR